MKSVVFVASERLLQYCGIESDRREVTTVLLRWY